MMPRKDDTVIRIPCTIDNFFRYWIEFLQPFHNLTEREKDIFASIIKYRYELSLVITDEAILDRVLMSQEGKKHIMEECNLTNSYFQALLTKLRKRKLIVDGGINPKYIPSLDKEKDSFKMLLLFQFDGLQGNSN